MTQPTATNLFFRFMGTHLGNTGPILLCGDFNCVLDSHRDVRGPAQGRPTWNATELSYLISDFNLHDAWVDLKGSEFRAMWHRGLSESRLDRFYVTQDLVTAVADVRVMSFPSGTPYVSDDNPVLLTIRTGDGRFNGARQWRSDSRVLQDEVTCVRIKNKLAQAVESESDPAAWDKRLAQAAGETLKARMTQELKDTLLRIRVIKRGGLLSPTMSEYLGELRDRYQMQLNRLTAPGTAFNMNGLCSGSPEVERFLDARQTGTAITAVQHPRGNIPPTLTTLRLLFTRHLLNCIWRTRAYRLTP